MGDTSHEHPSPWHHHTTDPALLSATELLALYRAKKLSPVEAVQATLARIERFNPIVNAYCHLDADGRAGRGRRHREARWMAGTPKGLLDGVPVGVKDNIHVAGMPSRFGSKLTPDAPQKIDSPAVARLKEQGAIVLGKTAMPEYGWKATSDSPLTGITRNPWDTRMTTGGSSAGAVASAVLGMGAVAAGHRRRRLDPHPRRLHRLLRPQADARPRAGLPGLAARHPGAPRTR